MKKDYTFYTGKKLHKLRYTGKKIQIYIYFK